MEEKKQFDPVKYKTDYVKEHYKRREIQLKHEENEKLEKVLNKKKQNLRQYTMENVQRDLKQ